MKQLLLIFALLFSISVQSENLYGEIVRVLKGDTFILSDSTNTEYLICVDGIACPELDQPFGDQAQKLTEELCTGEFITVEVMEVDEYNQFWGIVWIGDMNLNEKLLKDGLAWQDIRYNNSEDYAYFEEVARVLKLGLWANGRSTPPWEREDKSREEGRMVTEPIRYIGKGYVCHQSPQIYHIYYDCLYLVNCPAKVSETKSSYSGKLFLCNQCNHNKNLEIVRRRKKERQERLNN